MTSSVASQNGMKARPTVQSTPYQLVLTLSRYSSKECSDLQELQTNIAALTKPRIPRWLARLQHPKNVHDVLPFQEYAALNRLFTKFETLVEEWIETKPLVADQLCSVCDKYEWIIPPGADDLRINAVNEGFAANYNLRR